MQLSRRVSTLQETLTLRSGERNGALLAEGGSSANRMNYLEVVRWTLPW